MRRCLICRCRLKYCSRNHTESTPRQDFPCFWSSWCTGNNFKCLLLRLICQLLQVIDLKELEVVMLKLQIPLENHSRFYTLIKGLFTNILMVQGLCVWLRHGSILEKTWFCNIVTNHFSSSEVYFKLLLVKTCFFSGYFVLILLFLKRTVLNKLVLFESKIRIWHVSAHQSG